MTDFENKHRMDDEVPLNLKGSLKSFLGTGLAPLIRESLVGSGINPSMYDPEEYGHENYHGFPITNPIGDRRGEVDLSPIMLAVGEKLEKGEIVIDSSVNKTVQLKPWTAYPADRSDPFEGNTYKLSKLFSISLEGLVDAETGETLAYAVSLGSDGGKPGHALISTNDVQPIPTDK